MMLWNVFVRIDEIFSVSLFRCVGVPMCLCVVRSLVDEHNQCMYCMCAREIFVYLSFGCQMDSVH